MSTPLIQLVDVSIARGGRILLKDVNWTIHRGEHWALIGPSGSGKTSMAEVLAGTRRALRGHVRYSFAEEDAPPHGSVILLSAESQMDTRANLSPYYQARWNSSDEENSRTVRYFLSAQGIYGMSEFHVLSEDGVPRRFHDWRRVAVDVTGVPGLLERKLVDLSNGELHKVLLARALAQKPRLLIVDDPLSGLDAETRQRMLALVDHLAGTSNLTLIVVAHRVCDLPRSITHVLHLSRGRAWVR